MSVVIEGEASETDEEENEIPIQVAKKVVHVDEKVQQYWRHLATDMQTVLWRRSQTAVKTINEQKELAHNSFQSVQNAASSLRVVSVNLRQIQEELKDIEEATNLLPSKFESSVSTIKLS